MVKTVDFYTRIQQALNFVDVDVVEKVTKNWRENFQKHVGIGRRVFIVGNGGSLAVSEHISTDLNKRCKVKALTLSNNSFSTALSNDYGFENALVEWMKINHFDQTDFLVAISSSGKSPNVLNAINHANDCLGYVLAIFGMDCESPFTDYRYEYNYIHIDSNNYGVCEITSEIILHGIVEEMVIE